MKPPKHRPWEVLRSEYLARKPWFTVRHEAIRSPEGREVPDYYVFEYPEWVNVIALTRDGRFVIIDQYRHGLGRTDYELVAGCVEPTDTSVMAAAQRELREETGYGGGTWRHLMSLSANPATQNNMAHTFVATGVELLGDQRLDPTEEIGVHLLSADEVMELLCEGRIPQALMAAPLWRYFAEQKQ